MKKVLWITSFFPPRVNVATNRNVKFLKYLPNYGWEILIAPPKENRSHSIISSRLMGQLNSSVVVLSMPRDPFFLVHDRAGMSRISRYTGYLINNMIPPDGHIFWCLLALSRLEMEIRKHKPDVVYTTCSPFSINLIGAWAKSKFGIPWVTDFRDLWSLNPSRKRFLNRYHLGISNLLERSYLAHCDALIVNTEISAFRMIKKYPFLETKTSVIPNGFDQEDVPSEPCPRIEKTFFYGGLIDSANDYTPLPILSLLSKLYASGIVEDSWTVHYAGGQGEEFSSSCQKAGITGKERTHGYLDHEDFYKLIRSMSYVLMCMPAHVDTSSWIPARFYDYAGNGSRIICLAPRSSEIAGMIKQYGNGITLFYDEPDHVKLQRVHEFISHKENFFVSEEFLERYSRRNLAGQLSTVLMNVVAE